MILLTPTRLSLSSDFGHDNSYARPSEFRPYISCIRSALCRFAFPSFLLPFLRHLLPQPPRSSARVILILGNPVIPSQPQAPLSTRSQTSGHTTPYTPIPLLTTPTSHRTIKLMQCTTPNDLSTHHENSTQSLQPLSIRARLVHVLRPYVTSTFLWPQLLELEKMSALSRIPVCVLFTGPNI